MSEEEIPTGFGWITIRGTTYRHDIIIHADGTVTKRRKKKSKPFVEAHQHTPLSELELDFLESESPEIIYIGSGQSGDLPVTSGAEKILKRYGYAIAPTPEILLHLDEEKRRYIAFIHVTF